MLMLDPATATTARPHQPRGPRARVGIEVAATSCSTGEPDARMGATSPVAASFPRTDHRRFRVLTAFPLTRSVSPCRAASTAASPSRSPRPARQLLEGGLSVLRKGGEVALDEAKGDKRGPISIAAAVSVPAPERPLRRRRARVPGGSRRAAAEAEPGGRVRRLGLRRQRRARRPGNRDCS